MMIRSLFLLGTSALLWGCVSPSPLLYRPEIDSIDVRSTTAATAMVVSAHPLASAAGISVLRAGGNAADAAIAALSTLNVTEPHASGLGGGGFCLYYDSRRDSFLVIDYRERAPGEVNRSRYYDAADTLHVVREHGATAIGTPGAPAGWQAIAENFCTRPLPELLRSAETIADTGFFLTVKQVDILMDHLKDIEPDTAICAIFLDEGFPPQAGFRVRQPQLAATLRTLGDSKFTTLYQPPYADDIASAVRARGGSLSEEDLASYRAQFRRPLRGFYHGFEIITLPPPSLGGTALLEILRVAERRRLHTKAFLSAEYVHCLAAASRQALKDVTTWISDPDFDEQPVEHLLSDAWIEQVSARVDDLRPDDPAVSWDPRQANRPGNTTHLVVVDEMGNIVSLTQSINDFYGAGVMAPRTGLLLNNHMGDFSADSSRRNSVRPFRRPASNMAATIVRKDGRPILVIGSPGGARIAPTMAQVLTSVLDGHLTLDDALRAPRFFPQGSTLIIESRLPAETMEGLRRKGWKIAVNGRLSNYFGGVHAIQIDHRIMTGAADPRRDGAPAGWTRDTTFDLISEARITGAPSDYHGFTCYDFVFEGHPAKVVVPHRTAEGRPWLWRARFWGHEPQTELALLERGFHVVYCDVSELFGNDRAIGIWDRFYSMLTSAGLSRRSSFIAFSRGGVYAYRWAARFPDRVACVYADAPVLDLKSWPGGKGRGHGNPEEWERFKKDFGLRSEEEALAFTGNPLDMAREIARGGFPMLHICGDADVTVPIEENTDPFEERILQNGGLITVIRKPGVGHHPHSLADPTPIVEFILRATYR